MGRIRPETTVDGYGGVKTIKSSSLVNGCVNGEWFNMCDSVWFVELFIECGVEVDIESEVNQSSNEGIRINVKQMNIESLNVESTLIVNLFKSTLITELLKVCIGHSSQHWLSIVES